MMWKTTHKISRRESEDQKQPNDLLLVSLAGGIESSFCNQFRLPAVSFPQRDKRDILITGSR
jgi:hypothetical protein